MYPWKNSIAIDKKAAKPVYIQISNAFIKEIVAGRLQSGQKIPGTRQMAALLSVNRKTVVCAYDELTAQDWLEVIPAQGTFVARSLPIVKQKPLSQQSNSLMTTPAATSIVAGATQAAFTIIQPPNQQAVERHTSHILRITDGSPDVRLAPMEDIYKRCRRIAVRGAQRLHLRYGDEQGEIHLRETLAHYLRETRGFHCTPEQLLLTRGSQMGIYLTLQLLLVPGDKVIVGEVSYPVTNQVIRYFRGEIVTVPIDKQGIDVDKVAALCQQDTIRAMYLTPHHHYPTTVTLTAERRLRLLQLAQQYRIAIIEDDYDYDFHYASSPVLPLASLDTQGVVIYIGSFTKCIAPAIRTGYVVAPTNVIQALAQFRKMQDRQGDPVLERALSEFIADGELQRHLKKVLKTYRQRRDHCCMLLEKHLGRWASFHKPDGGMAVWIQFSSEVDLVALSQYTEKHQISLEGYEHWLKFNALRLGFASLNNEEMEKSILTLKEGIERITGR